MKNADISYTNQASTIASALIEAKKHEDKATSCREEANKLIVSLHKAKVVVGRYNTCAVATAFVDTLVQGGLAKKTAQNYLSLFKDAVATGKPVKDWGGVKGGKSRKDVKGTKVKTSKAFADLFRPSFNHDGGKTFQALCKAIEKDYKDDKIKSMYEGFVEYFKAEGDQIAE
jgi:hypothetical protein